MKRYFQHYTLLAPFMVLFAAFFLFPIASGLYHSFFEWKGPQDQVFVGLGNYTDILGSRHFRIAMSNLFLYVAITVPVGISTALALALLIDHFSGTVANFFRAAYFLPVMLPLFMAATIWRWIYTPNFGLLNTLLGWIGAGPVKFLNDPDTMLYSAIAVDVWVSAGFNMVILLAGLKGVPRHYYEAARLDGASKLQEILWITIPAIKPVLLFTVTYGFISALQVFDIPWLLTGSSFADYGGRQNRLLFPVMDMMGRAFGSIKFGEAAAYGFLLTIAIVALTSVSLYLGRDRE
ncbi:MAG: carbohydrate ABC transporter permease [Qingshengfaniella sp.]